MQPFTQKYAIILLLKDMPVGTRYTSSNWPPHVTVADTFAIDWSVDVMVERFTELLKNYPRPLSIAEDDRFFGEHGQVQVVRLEKTDSLAKLHYDVIHLLEQGGWKPNDPQFTKEGFLPHSTVQKHARLNKGEEVSFDALSIIDFFPDEDPYQRKLLATIKIGK